MPLNIQNIRSTCCYIVSCFMLRRATSPLQQSSWGKPHGDHPHGVNGGCTRPKGPGHPAEGLGVNCLPLGLSGHCSSPGGKALQSYCVVYTLYSCTSFAFHSKKFSCTQCTKVQARMCRGQAPTPLTLNPYIVQSTK